MSVSVEKQKIEKGDSLECLASLKRLASLVLCFVTNIL